MRKIVRHTASKVLSLAVVAQLIVPSAAFAGYEATCSNETTQGGSVNTCDSRIAQRLAIINRNEAEIENEIKVESNTGNNTIKEVNGNVSYTSGDVEVDYEVKNEANFNTSTIDLGGQDVSVHTENKETQSNGDNFALGNVVIDALIVNDNELEVENEVKVKTDTGNNDILEVNGDVDGVSGDVDVQGSIETKGNVNESEVNGFGDVSLTAKNNRTQSDGYNVAESNARLGLRIENRNEVDVENEVKVMAFTGDNDLKEVNGDVKSWDSGDVDVKLDTTNGGDKGLNNNRTIVDNWANSVTIETENYETQGNSENFAFGEVALMLDILNKNKELDIDNEFEVFADTGLNDVLEVNGDVDFESGKVDIESMLENKGNVNFTEVDGGGDFVANARNERTQSDSVNEAYSMIGIMLKVDNFNEADIENEADLLGFTGENSAKEVNGDLGLGTGDVSLKSGAMSDANYNTTKVLSGAEDATTKAENVETQSDSTNIACATIDRGGNLSKESKCGTPDYNVDDYVSNDNELEVENDMFEFGDTGMNHILEVNGAVDFDSGMVDQGSHAESTGNVNHTEL